MKAQRELNSASRSEARFPVSVAGAERAEAPAPARWTGHPAARDMARRGARFRHMLAPGRGDRPPFGWQDLPILALGIWIFSAARVLSPLPPTRTPDLVGGAIILLALWAALRSTGPTPRARTDEPA